MKRSLTMLLFPLAHSQKLLLAFQIVECILLLVRRNIVTALNLNSLLRFATR